MQSLSALRVDKRVGVQSLSWFNRTPESPLLPVSEPTAYGNSSEALAFKHAAKLLDDFSTGAMYCEFVVNTDNGDTYFVANSHVYTVHGTAPLEQKTTSKRTSSSNSVYYNGYLYYLKDLIAYRLSTTTWLQEEFTTLNTDVNYARILLHGDYMYIMHTSDQRVHLGTGVVSANPMEPSTESHSVFTAVIGDKAYLKTSSTWAMEIYDFADNTWERIPNKILYSTGYWNTKYSDGTCGSYILHGNSLVYLLITKSYNSANVSSGYTMLFDIEDHTQLELIGTQAAGVSLSGMPSLIDMANNGAFHYDPELELVYLWKYATVGGNVSNDLYVVSADSILTTSFMKIED
jgi:hypothetical protein